MKARRPPTPSARARMAAGFTVAEAARLAQVSPEYLLACERRNQFPWVQMLFLARLYGVGIFVLSPLAQAREKEMSR